MSDYVDLPEALEMLGTSRPTLYRWLRDGRVQGYRVGRQWRFARADLERFVRGAADDPLGRDLRDAIAFFRERAARRRKDGSNDDNQPRRRAGAAGKPARQRRAR
jgi:excisionase family DNA binding protein